jgi:hypothetical protein
MLKEGLQAFGAVKKHFQMKSNDLRKILPNFLAEFLRRRTGHFRLPSVIMAQVKDHLSDRCEFYQSPGISYCSGMTWFILNSFTATDPQSGSPSVLYTGPRRVGRIGATVQHGPRSTIDLDLCGLPPRFPGVLAMTAVANIEKLAECTIVLRSPWYLDKTVMFEMFYDANCFGRESVELRNGTSDFNISLSLPQAIVTLQEEEGERCQRKSALTWAHKTFNRSRLGSSHSCRHSEGRLPFLRRNPLRERCNWPC